MSQDRDRAYPYTFEHCVRYLDYFSDEHANIVPLILDNGTSVIFPKGWTDEEADKWRKGMELQRPNDYPTSSYQTFH